MKTPEIEESISGALEGCSLIMGCKRQHSNRKEELMKIDLVLVIFVYVISAVLGYVAMKLFIVSPILGLFVTFSYFILMFLGHKVIDEKIRILAIYNNTVGFVVGLLAVWLTQFTIVLSIAILILLRINYIYFKMIDKILKIFS